MSKNDLEIAKERWLRDLTPQGRIRYLKQYSPDRLAELFPPLTPGFFEKELQKIGDRPVPGERVAKIEATPRKKTIRVKAEHMGKEEAVLELIDNCIDNYYQCKSNGHSQSLVVDLRVFEDEILLIENSGGIRPKNLLAFVAIGAEGHEKGAATIGVWSEAQKIAFYALGNETVVVSRYFDQTERYHISDEVLPAVAIRLDRDWYHDDTNWDVPVFLPASEIPAGQTRYSIQNLHGPYTPEQIESLRQRLTSVYSDLLIDMQDRGFPINILVNGSPIEVLPTLTDKAILEKFVYAPFMSPLWVEEVIDETVDGRRIQLNVRVLAGLTADYDKANVGVYMWGVPGIDEHNRLGPRLFEQRFRDTAPGHGNHGNRLLNWSDSTLGRLQIYVVFRGRSTDIPWKGPTKWEYSPTNPVAERIRSFIKSVGDHYARFSRMITDLDVVPFSSGWNLKGQGERLNFYIDEVGGLDSDPILCQSYVSRLPLACLADSALPDEIPVVSRSDFRALTQTVAVDEMAAQIRARREAVNPKAPVQAKIDATIRFLEYLHPAPRSAEQTDKQPEELGSAAPRVSDEAGQSHSPNTGDDDDQQPLPSTATQPDAPKEANTPERGFFAGSNPKTPSTPSLQPAPRTRTVSCKMANDEIAQLGQLTGQTAPSDILRTVISTYTEFVSAVSPEMWADLAKLTGQESKTGIVRTALLDLHRGTAGTKE